jgi:hypothetical protein
MSVSAYVSLVVNASRFLDDKFAKWSDEDHKLLANEGAMFLQNELKILKNHTTISSVDNQARYAMADEVLEPLELEVNSGGMWYKCKGVTLDDFRSAKTTVYGSHPYCYTFVDDERNIEFWPVWDASAQTTTLSTDITAASTSMTVASASNFPDQGRLLIDSEVIEYTAKTSTTLTGLARAKERTSAAAHTATAIVTARNIKILGARRILGNEMFRCYTTGTVSTSSTTVTGVGTAFTTNAAAGDAFAAGAISLTSVSFATDAAKWYRIASVTDDTHLVLEKPYAETALSGAAYTISSPSPFPVEYDSFLRAYMISKALEKVGDFDGSARQWAQVMFQLNNKKGRAIKPDTELYPHGRYDRKTPLAGMSGNHGPHYAGW